MSQLALTAAVEHRASARNGHSLDGLKVAIFSSHAIGAPLLTTKESWFHKIFICQVVASLSLFRFDNRTPLPGNRWSITIFVSRQSPTELDSKKG